jgi:phospholipid transport system substrate-binding protein
MAAGIKVDTLKLLARIGWEIRDQEADMGSRITRRGLTVLASLCFIQLLTAAPFTPGAVAASDPQDIVRGLYRVLFTNMRDGRTLGASGRLARLAPVVDRIFDIPAMTQLAVGSSWTNFNPTEQQRLIDAFRHYVAATYADQFDTYSGEQLQVTGERPHGAGVVVQTRIVKSNGDATRLDYLTRQDQGGPRISDVYLDGSISQLAVHRSEFHSILQREGIDGLVLALNRKVDLLRNVAKAS